ncbi:MAG: hypothetical protein AAFN70_07425, partial [Planctomycetota bacterium]
NDPAAEPAGGNASSVPQPPPVPTPSPPPASDASTLVNVSAPANTSAPPNTSTPTNMSIGSEANNRWRGEFEAQPAAEPVADTASTSADSQASNGTTQPVGQVAPAGVPGQESLFDGVEVDPASIKATFNQPVAFAQFAPAPLDYDPADFREFDEISDGADSGKESGLAFTGSMMVHLAILVVLALWWYTPDFGGVRNLSLVVSETEDTSFDMGVAADLAVEMPQADVQQEEPVEVQEEPVDLTDLLQPAQPASRLTTSDLHSTTSNRVIGGASGGGATGEKSDVEFFGAHAYGTKFVFILDASTSMLARGGRRLERAQQKLLESVADLGEDKQYCVLLFNDTMFHMPSQRSPNYVTSNGESLVEIRQWFYDPPLRPATDPRKALLAAGKLKPDAVFLLSDGDFNNGSMDGPMNVMNIVRRYMGGVPIHTIAYENQACLTNMKQIGKLTGGTVTFVSANERLKPQMIDIEPVKRANPANQPQRSDKNLRVTSEKMMVASALAKARRAVFDGEYQRANQLLGRIDQDALNDVQKKLYGRLVVEIENALTPKGLGLTADDFM